MAADLAFAIITPHTVRKSRTGAVLARLLGRTSSELVAMQMFAPTRELAEQYAASIGPGREPDDEPYRELIRDYILENMSPDPDGRRHRVLMVVFRGTDAFRDVSEVVGHLKISCHTGETIRDTYGDLVRHPGGSVRYFEPAVLTADSADTVASELRMWLEFARRQPAVLENICEYDAPSSVEQTLALIKPDSWRSAHRSRPGAIIDMFSRTGLRIIGCKYCRMSVAQALRFYGPVRASLTEKLAPEAGARARKLLERGLKISLTDETQADLTALLGEPYAQEQFARIVAFMTGRDPTECPESELDQPGTASCLALVYEGGDAISKIRTVLGPTDPTKAPAGTIRREFGSDVMVNTAHASDSLANAAREMAILRLHESNFVPIVEEALAQH